MSTCRVAHPALKLFSKEYYNLFQKPRAPTKKLADQVEAVLKDIVYKMIVQRDRRIWISTSLNNFREVIAKLIEEENYLYLTTITAVELKSEFELIYHLTFTEAIISVKVKVGQNDAELPTITDLTPGATLYEREINDMFGVKFNNHPDLSPLLLPDGWKKDICPLRKWWTQARISKAMEKHEDRD
jgi:NADH:ubiquinone oxidoreductase subunit C